MVACIINAKLYDLSATERLAFFIFNPTTAGDIMKNWSSQREEKFKIKIMKKDSNMFVLLWIFMKIYSRLLTNLQSNLDVDNKVLRWSTKNALKFKNFLFRMSSWSKKFFKREFTLIFKTFFCSYPPVST